MGFNATYFLLEKVDIHNVKNAFVDLFEDECRFVKGTFLTLENWKTQRNLFCIGLTPLSCFDLDSSGWDEKYILVNFSDYPGNLNWESLSKLLDTTIKIFGVYDNAGEYSYTEYRNGQCIISKRSQEVCYTIIQHFVPENFYNLESYPGRINKKGEHFLVFESNKETFYEDSTVGNELYGGFDSDEEDILF